jgi:hypothetical protein
MKMGQHDTGGWNVLTVIYGGDWTRTDGTLTLDADSKVLYTTDANSTMAPEVYGHIEHMEVPDPGGCACCSWNFHNTSGNFAASQNITAGGIVWTAGSLTGTPSQAWNIGTDGITIDGGAFKATTGTFTVAGDWMQSGGTFTHDSSNVDFNGATAQTITSGGSSFFSVSISNTSAAEVSLLDPFEFTAVVHLLLVKMPLLQLQV